MWVQGLRTTRKHLENTNLRMQAVNRTWFHYICRTPMRASNMIGRDRHPGSPSELDLRLTVTNVVRRTAWFSNRLVVCTFCFIRAVVYLTIMDDVHSTHFVRRGLTCGNTNNSCSKAAAPLNSCTNFRPISLYRGVAFGFYLICIRFRMVDHKTVWFVLFPCLVVEV